MTLQKRAPGKLFVAGEYSVVSPGRSAVLVSVDRFVTVTVAEAASVGRLTSHYHRNISIQELLRPEPSEPGEAAGKSDYALAAITLFIEYVREIGKELPAFDLNIDTEMISSDGRKYGLGSSAAVTSALMQALCEFASVRLSDNELYKLCMLSALRISPHGSGADIASTVYSGWIRYTSPDRRWVEETVRRTGIRNTIAEEWPHLQIQRLPAPKSVTVNVGWTGEPVETPAMLGSLSDMDPAKLRQFYDESDSAVEALSQAIIADDASAILSSLSQTHEALKSFERLSGLPIETEQLAHLRRSAESIGGRAKPSGAGGGDCGIVLTRRDTPDSRMLEDWEKRGIIHLPLAVYSGKGALMTVDTNTGSARRKDDHVRLAKQQAANSFDPNDFDAVQFVHHSLASTDIESVELTTQFAGLTLPTPLYINAMTGGSDLTRAINEKLGRVAHRTGLAIAAGSMSAALRDPSVRESYTVLRECNPNGLIFANLSANATPEQARDAVKLLGADALQLHLNSVQEVVMPEGDRAFTHWPDRIAAVAEASDVPVIVKEVGFGMSAETVETLSSLGIRIIDVSGRGGTNFARIEYSRRSDHAFSELGEWGQSTVLSLLEAHHRAERDETLTVLASGGIRSPLDAVKSFALGARAAGVAGLFLRILEDAGEDALVREIELWKEQMRALSALLGASKLEDLQHTDIILRGAVREYCQARNVDVTGYATRSHKRWNRGSK